MKNRVDTSDIHRIPSWREGQSTYVLGLDYHVKDVIHWTDAVTNILQGKMTPFMVHPTKRIRSANATVDLAHPIIVRLNYWRNIPAPLTKSLDSRAKSREILVRDGWTCAYCGEKADTVDHIKPESLCKKHKDPHNGWTWGNLVAACFSCNQRKGSNYPEDVGMKLLWTPHVNGVDKYALVQAEVWKILETGDGYVTETTPAEGSLKNVK